MGGTDRLKKPHSSDGTEFFLFCLWDRVLHIRLASNSLYSPGWPWTSDFEPLILPPPLPSAGVTGLLLDTLFYTVLGGNSGLFACYTAICLLSCMPSPENSALWRNQRAQEQKEGMDTGVRALGEEGLFTLMIALSCRHRWGFRYRGSHWRDWYLTLLVSFSPKPLKWKKKKKRRGLQTTESSKYIKPGNWLLLQRGFLKS